MPLYHYKGIDTRGVTHTGEIQAESKGEVTDHLSQQGLLPVIIEERKFFEKKDRFKQLTHAFTAKKVAAMDTILVARHLSVIIKAGLSLTEALEIVIKDSKNPSMKMILRKAKSTVESGESLSSAFSNYPHIFSPVFVGLVRAGERSGTLDITLSSLSNQLLRDYDLKKRVQMAMIYPAILLLASAGVIVLLMTFVLPRMIKAFGGIRDELPAITRFFIAISEVLGKNPWVTVAIFVLCIIGAWLLFVRSLAGRRVLFRIFQHLPISSEVIQKMALARFSRTFRNLLLGGTSAIEAIEISAKTIGNPTYQDDLLRMSAELKRGSNLSAAFLARPHLYPSFFASLALVGERTGTLEKSLETISAFYEDEVDRLLKNSVSLIEPFLILVMGVVVALVAVAVLLPIFRLTKTLIR